MSDEQPRFDAYIAPLLKLLKEYPEGLTTTEVYDELASRMGLTEEQRVALLPSGSQLVFHNRIGWAHDRLKRGGYSESVKRGVWALTEEGRQFFRSVRGEIPGEDLKRLAYPGRYEARAENSPIKEPPSADESEGGEDQASGHGEGFTVLEAAKIVLADAGAPLHNTEITRRMIEQGLWETEGLTPAATVSAVLAVDIKRRGESSDFRRTEPGYFELNLDGVESTSEVEIIAEEEAAEDRSSAREGRGEKSTIEPVSFTDGAERILQVFAEREPMHVSVITDRALDLGLIMTESKDPAATMYSSIIQETERRKGRGDIPRFDLLGEGMIGLTRWHQTGLTAYIEAHNDSVRRRLHEKLHEMDPTEFEDLVGRLLVTLGFPDAKVTSRQNDGGIDVRGTLVVGDVIRTRMAVQVKRWKNNVHAPTIQQVRGSLGTHEQGLIITTSDFSAGARQEAERPDAVPVGLMNGEQLVKLLIEHSLEVEKEELSLLRLG